jgi:hypothetical protein
MSSDDPYTGRPSTPTRIDDSYTVTLPCDPEQFGEFVSGLLGKPQTIESTVRGVFSIGRDEVVNTFHLVNQRVRQQNDAGLIQFTVRVVYSDDSSVLINSIEDFVGYSEIRPLVSIGVVLSWTYLIKFPNKRVPEKQEISVSFRCDRGIVSSFIDDGHIIVRNSRNWSAPSGIFIRISHTDRTWGVDIESLLVGQIKTLLKRTSRTEQFIYTHSDSIGVWTGVLLFLSAVGGAFVTSTRFLDSYIFRLEALSVEASTNEAAFSAKLDFLVEIITTGVWPRFFFSVIVFIVLAIIFSIALGTWVGTKANNVPDSDVLLSKAAIVRQTERMGRRRRDWVLFGLSLAASIATGMISNVIFSRYFGGF